MAEGEEFLDLGGVARECEGFGNTGGMPGIARVGGKTGIIGSDDVRPEEFFEFGDPGGFQGGHHGACPFAGKSFLLLLVLPVIR